MKVPSPRPSIASVHERFELSLEKCRQSIVHSVLECSQSPWLFLEKTCMLKYKRHVLVQAEQLVTLVYSVVDMPMWIFSLRRETYSL